jgi:hypothetical protein
MLDENIWMSLTEEEKFTELCAILDTFTNIEEKHHPFCKSKEQGKLPEVRKELEKKFFKIIELENVI